MIDPRNYHTNETLDDGTEVEIRAITPADGASILEAFKGLDREAVYRRFFAPKKELTKTDIKQLTEVDFSNVVALVATTDHERVLGGGRYAVSGSSAPHVAELAFLTVEDFRGRGVAGLVLKHLACLAEAAGLSQFEADVLAENQSMLAVFRRSGLPMRLVRDGATVHVTLSLPA